MDPNPPGGIRNQQMEGSKSTQDPLNQHRESQNLNWGVPNTPGQTQTYLGRAQNQHLQGQKALGNLKFHLGTPKSTPNSAGQTRTYLEDPKHLNGPKIHPGTSKSAPGDPKYTQEGPKPTWEDPKPTWTDPKST